MRASLLAITLSEYKNYVTNNYREKEFIRKKLLESLNYNNMILATVFYRYFDAWGPELELFLRELIIRKVEKNNYNIIVKSVGASSGKEVYSIGSAVYAELCDYAL
ncbi:MAG: hypothetical protein P9M13_02215 [Candidatus Ancaeobacter aquaticus]|nr:hypothetical protein [Candidatus Ancaeobacter aquaticus]